MHMTRAAYIRWPLSLIAAALSIACSSQDSRPTNSQRSGFQSGVDSAASRLLAALRSDSPDSLLTLMADDVIIMPPNEPVLNGKAAVRTWYEQLVKQMRTSSLNVTHRELLVGGDYATEIAEFEWNLMPVTGGSAVTDRGSYMQVWHRQPDGRWLFSREVWNSTTPLGH